MMLNTLTQSVDDKKFIIESVSKSNVACRYLDKEKIYEPSNKDLTDMILRGLAIPDYVEVKSTIRDDVEYLNVLVMREIDDDSHDIITSPTSEGGLMHGISFIMYLDTKTKDNLVVSMRYSA